LNIHELSYALSRLTTKAQAQPWQPGLRWNDDNHFSDMVKTERRMAVACSNLLDVSLYNLLSCLGVKQNPFSTNYAASPVVNNNAKTFTSFPL
jgi:hypothetical protein